jgi:glycosyltransferase involved in cell wall biosynthesis
MSLALIDYGCHSFSYRLSAYLHSRGYPIRYIANGSLESPNLESLDDWSAETPDLVQVVSCRKPYGKMSLKSRITGEIEWATNCIQRLTELQPSAILTSCAPLSVVPRLQGYAASRGIPFLYWLQDLQGRAIGEVFKGKVPLLGKSVGRLAEQFESQLLEKSRFVITIAQGHANSLPESVRREKRFELLENWANIEDVPLESHANEWAQQHGLAETRNVIYSGTLGFKHDWMAFIDLAKALRHRSDVRVVLVSSGGAADRIKADAASQNLSNLIVLPFQPFSQVSKVMGAATILIAPLGPSAGSFCVPSKILSYHCAGRPTVLSIDIQNPAAAMLSDARSGIAVPAGDRRQFNAAVCELLADPSRCVELGRNARRYAEQSFNLPAVAERFLSILAKAGVTSSVNIDSNRSPSVRNVVVAGV